MTLGTWFSFAIFGCGALAGGAGLALALDLRAQWDKAHTGDGLPAAPERERLNFDNQTTRVTAYPSGRGSGDDHAR